VWVDVFVMCYFSSMTVIKIARAPAAPKPWRQGAWLAGALAKAGVNREQPSAV